MLNIAVLVSGGGTNLQALIDAEKAGKIENGRISVVVASKPGVYALERARNAGIEGVVLARKDFESVDDYSAALEKLLKEKQTDLIVLAGFMTITNAAFTKAFENRIINVHPALIPSFCGKGYYGLHVHEAAPRPRREGLGRDRAFRQRGLRRRPDHPAEGGAGRAGRHARNAAAPHHGAGGVAAPARGGLAVLRGPAFRWTARS
mgnify:CR=1 FL=1